MSVLVVMQRSNDEWVRCSFEALTAGLQIADAYDFSLDAVVLGHGMEAQATEIAGYHVNQVYALDHPLLAEYTAEAWTLALEQLINQSDPMVVLFPHTYQVRDYAPKLAARFGSALMSDAIAIRSEGYPMYAVRQRFLGKLQEDVCTSDVPAFVSIQAGAFAAMAPEPEDEYEGDAAIKHVKLKIRAEEIVSRPEPPIRNLESGVDLSTARIIVSVGRGIKEPEDLMLAEALAKELGGEIAGSRPICDSGLLPMDRLIGSSGQTVNPELYVAVGISGAIQHQMGMKGAKTVVAINSDGTAPIFHNAHYGIVGDLREVVPALIEELRSAKR